MTKGAKDAPKAEKPQAAGGEDGRAEAGRGDPAPKLTEKKEIKRRRREKTPEPQAAAQARSDRREAQEAGRAEEAKPRPRPKPLPPKKPAQQQQPKFDADKIAALLDKRDPQRNAATGAELNSAPTLGTATGNAAKLSQIGDRRAALAADGAVESAGRRRRIRKNSWSASGIRLDRDGKLARRRRFSPAAAACSSMRRATAQCARCSVGQPFDMLRPEHYETWKDIEVTFDPRDMFRG